MHPELALVRDHACAQSAHRYIDQVLALLEPALEERQFFELYEISGSILVAEAVSVVAASGVESVVFGQNQLRSLAVDDLFDITRDLRRGNFDDISTIGIMPARSNLPSIAIEGAIHVLNQHILVTSVHAKTRQEFVFKLHLSHLFYIFSAKLAGHA